jgi:polyhydroxyalkanoate synthesis regulator phasin
MNANENLNRSFAVAENMIEKFWDMMLVGLGGISWSQEQAENMIKKYMEQNKQNREETAKLVEEVMNQVKKNQLEMQKMVQEAVKTAIENTSIPNYNLFNDFTKKMEELTKKVDKL